MRHLIFSLAVASLLLSVVSCKKADDNSVVIFTSTEDFRTEHIQKLLKEKFPQYKINIEVLSTGNHAAKLKAEGTSTLADITINLETGYMEGLSEMLSDLHSYNESEFLPELVPENRKFLPWDKSSGAIIINKNKLTALGLSLPTSYDDLLDPSYKGLISMPNPKTSGTGYMFLVSLINAWGEDEAFAYFDKLAKNILQFTTSGSGPVNALIQGEVAIGLGMTLTAVQAINSKGAQLEIIFFSEGAPSITTSMGIIKGKETRKAVQDVFAFIIDKLVKDDKELYCPEPIFIDQTNSIPNYPANIFYADCNGIYDAALKERLLARWQY